MTCRSQPLARLAGIAAAALTLASCSAGTSADEQSAAGGPEYIQEHNIQQLMANVVQPTADIYWGSVQYISDEQGEHDIRPETDEEWLATRTAAGALTEYGNLLMTPLYAQGRGQDWMDFARGLVEIGAKAEQAAIDRDPDAVFEVGGNLYNVCRGCHQLYPPENLPDDDAASGEDVIRPEPGTPLEEYQEQTDD